MDLSSYALSLLRSGDLTLYRGTSKGVASVLLVTAENGSLVYLNRLEREYAFRGELDAAWAARPIALTRCNDRPTLVLEDPGGEPLDQLLSGRLEATIFLRIAIGLTQAVRGVHERGLIHKDVKPANVLVDVVSGSAWLTGFGLASRLPREHQNPDAPEVIAGTLAYMAPEQTGWMNRSIDARSDLYSLGITFYEMLTGMLPFTAADPLEWVHCHIARQPTAPDQRVATVPAQLSAIVMKLMSKNAEERYQTAAGVEMDLRQCLAQWKSHGRFDPFPLGRHDMSDRLVIPEQLYGREREIDALFSIFDRVSAHGLTQLVLVSGYAGIGKSSVVNELHKALVPSRGLFASGKFDQYKRDIPYATLGQAFQSLVRSLLGQSEAKLGRWRDALREGLAPNGQLVVNLVPELELIIGVQPSVPDLAPQETKHRFQMVFREFVRVFARREHPLALLLDDLQWLDEATLDVIEDLSTQPDMQHLMLIAAYRDNEVDSGHPLMQKLEAIRRAGASVQEIRLTSLSIRDLTRLVVDCLHCEPERAAPLAQLVHEKTAGNPFFSVQFISSLTEEGLLTFDHGKAQWYWDLTRIDARDSSDNVVDLMIRKLNRFPPAILKVLQQLACLGNPLEVDQLSLIYEDSEEMHVLLQEAVRTGLVVPSQRAYRFLHDRIQEAAYSSIPEHLRGAEHLRIGRLLAARTSPEEISDKIFDIVSQLNRGSHLMASLADRHSAAELNLIAGKRAKNAIAFASAVSYLAAGRALLTEDSWEQQYRLTFDLELNRAECEFMTGEVSKAEQRLAMLSPRAANFADLAAIIDIQAKLYTHVGKTGDAVAICLASLRRASVLLSPHPTDEDVCREYERMCQQIGARNIASLIDIPRMHDSEWRKVMNVMAALTVPANLYDANLMDLVIFRIANLSLEHGNTDESCIGYANLCLILGPRFGDYHAGYRFAQLSVDLVDKLGAERFKTRVYSYFGTLVSPWLRHIRESYAFSHRACEAALKTGDLTWASFAWRARVATRLACGDPLAEVQREAETGLAFARKVQFGLAIELISSLLRVTRLLRGQTPSFASFNDHEFDETDYERQLEGQPELLHALYRYWDLKLVARFYAEDYASALVAAAKAESMSEHKIPAFDYAEYHFYAALTHAALFASSSVDEKTRHFDALVVHHRQLSLWTEDCPANFLTRAALVGAEIARLEGRELDAERHYEEAIRSARENGFIQNEGLAQELAARFYAARGFETFSNAYLQNARACYLRWGADGKVRQMDLKYPHLVPHPQRLGSGPTLDTLIERLDLTTVVKLSQAVAGEIEINRLIKILMETVLEHAGAERGLLILPRGEGMWIEAEAITTKETVEVNRQKMRVGPVALPESVVHYVIRTRDSVLLDEAMDQEPFSQDPYILRSRSRSILCLPLIKQTQLIGVLYLENGLASHVFTPARIALLRLIASQAATSLENARLYLELRDADVFLTQAQCLSLTGSFCWRPDTGEITFSEELYRIFAFEQGSAVTLERVMARVHPEDVPLVKEKLEVARQGGSDLEYEIRLRMPDGSDKHLRTNAYVIRDLDGQLESVGAIQDVTQPRLAEEALSKARSELAHASTMTSIGALTATIAHEITQPLAAIVSNADSCLIWLANNQPNLDKARRAAERIVQDGHRAAEVIQSIRAQARRSASEMVLVDLNRLIVDTLELMQAELQRHEVLLETRLVDLALIKGDHTQLQQVIVNLVTNAIEAISTSRRSLRIIRVSTESNENGDVLTIVEDSGAGIDLQVLDRIFDPMFTTKPEGMGLGLSICRSIVEGHGGRLWVSPNPAGGSTFQFSVPDATTEVDASAPNNRARIPARAV
jgi:predicted ATPase/signal transduction histidine kinase/GAF domain-containing protein